MRKFQFLNLETALISQDEEFRISLAAPEESLRASLATLGMLQPLLVRKLPDNRYQPVMGFKRLQLARELLWPQVPVLLIAERCPEEELYTLALSDRSSMLNPLEIATVLFKLEQKAVARNRIVEHFLPLLGLGKNVKLFELYRPLYELDDVSKAELAQDWLSLDLLPTLVALSIPERHGLLHLFKSLRLGKNRQKEFCQLACDVSRMLNRDLCTLLQQPALTDVLSETTLTPSQKVERVKAELIRLRYPQYSVVQKKFNDLLKAAHLPPTCRLQAPLFFSHDEFSVSFTFKDSREFQQQVHELQRLADDGIIENMVGLA